MPPQNMCNDECRCCIGLVCFLLGTAAIVCVMVAILGAFDGTKMDPTLVNLTIENHKERNIADEILYDGERLTA